MARRAPVARAGPLRHAVKPPRVQHCRKQFPEVTLDPGINGPKSEPIASTPRGLGQNLQPSVHRTEGCRVPPERQCSQRIPDLRYNP